jgi:hypothetical protein
MTIRIGRRRFLLASSAAIVAACAPRVDLPQASATAQPDELDEISQMIASGGPPPDGIPPLEKPIYISIDEASSQWNDDAIVEAFVINEQPRAFPRLITVWHEIVNESVGGRPISITYCPPTGSTLVFSGVLPDGRTTTFGTSGMLYNSNLVMYDRATKSLWPQLFGVAVRGDRKGDRLTEIGGAVTTTLRQLEGEVPDRRRALEEHGPRGAYGTWPYGDYDTTPHLMFSVRYTDERFYPKKIVVGVRAGGEALAIPKDEFVAQRQERNFEVGGRQMVARYDAALNTVRVFARGTDDPVSAYDVMWFAWFTFNPKTVALR